MLNQFPSLPSPIFVVTFGVKFFSLWFKGSELFSRVCSAFCFEESFHNVVRIPEKPMAAAFKLGVTFGCVAPLYGCTGYP